MIDIEEKVCIYMVKLIDALEILPCDRNFKIIDYDSKAILYSGDYIFMPMEIFIKLADKEVILIDTAKHDDNFEITIVNEWQ